MKPMDWADFVDNMDALFDEFEAKSITVQEIARTAGVCTRTVQRWCDDGVLAGYQRMDSGQWVISRKDWEAKKAKLSAPGRRRGLGGF